MNRKEKELLSDIGEKHMLKALTGEALKGYKKTETER